MARSNVLSWCMKLPRFQFSLRTLMIGVTLLAVPCAFVGWQAKIVRERKAWLDARPEQFFVMAPYSVFARGDREQSPSHLRVSEAKRFRRTCWPDYVSQFWRLCVGNGSTTLDPIRCTCPLLLPNPI